MSKFEGPKIVTPIPGPKALGVIEWHKIVGDVRGRGLMIAVDLVKDRETKERFLDLDHILVEAHKRGLILLPCGINCIRVAPPLIVNQKQMEKGLDIIEQSISVVEKRL